MKDILVIILVGGWGMWFELFIWDCVKLVVFFGGNYWIIDFILSNCFNSGI